MKDMYVKAPTDRLRLSRFVFTSGALTDEAEVVHAAMHDAADIHAERTDVVEMSQFFACGVDFGADPLVRTVGKHGEFRVFSDKVRHVVLVVEPVVGHDGQGYKAKHVKLLKSIDE